MSTPEIDLNSSWKDVLRLARTMLDTPGNAEGIRHYLATATSVHVAKRLGDSIGETKGAIDALTAAIQQSGAESAALAVKVHRLNLLLFALTIVMAAAGVVEAIGAIGSLFRQ